MNRPIMLDDRDRDAHEKLVAELVQRTGWEVYAWVLLSDHYHLVMRTPEPNLVAGMKWFQNFWTKRFNARHDRGGPVFGGRYKSVLVQEDGHLSAVIDHVHLNAYRAGLVGAAHLASYPWSSLKDYLLPADSRRSWIRAEEGLAHMGYDGDCGEGRLRYLEHLEGTAIKQGGRPILPAAGRTLHSTLKRGWYLGEGDFRSGLLAARESRPRVSMAGLEGKHGAAMAQRILKAGLALGGLEYEGLDGLRKSDWRKRAIGRAIRLRTTVPTEWIASGLKMGVCSRAAALVARDPGPSWGKAWRNARELLDKLLELPNRDIPRMEAAEGDEEDKACCAESARGCACVCPD